MMWFDRGHPDAIFGDRRSETINVIDRSHGREGTRTIHVHPDALMDFRALPFGDATFRLVAFDPPHLVRAGPRSWLAAKYGKLGSDWRDDLRQGFVECFRVLHPDGVLVFKWNETQVKLAEVLPLSPYPPPVRQHQRQEGRHALAGVHEAKALMQAPARRARAQRAADEAAPIEWPRADPTALAAFDPRSKVCTMNCGPSTRDPRSDAERQLLCTDCLPRLPGRAA